jgi:GAF domain-containing protein
MEKELQKQMSTTGTALNALDTEIASLTTTVTNETTVEASAVALINGFAAQLATAVANAQAAGATPAELAELTALQAQVAASSTTLAAAVTANTPAAPAAPAAAA